MLADLGGPPPVDATGAAKLWVTSRALRLRRAQPELFTDYRSLTASGPAAGHLIAFERRGALTLATRLPVTLTRTGAGATRSVDLGGPVVDVLTDRRHEGRPAWPTCWPPTPSPSWSASRVWMGLDALRRRPTRG